LLAGSDSLILLLLFCKGVHVPPWDAKTTSCPQLCRIEDPTVLMNCATKLGNSIPEVSCQGGETKNCALCAKKRIANLKQSRSDPQLRVNSINKIYDICRFRPRFRMCAKQTTLITDESINDKRVSQKHKVAADFAGCNVRLTDI